VTTNWIKTIIQLLPNQRLVDSDAGDGASVEWPFRQKGLKNLSRIEKSEEKEELDKVINGSLEYWILQFGQDISLEDEYAILEDWFNKLPRIDCSYFAPKKAT